MGPNWVLASEKKCRRSSHCRLAEANLSSLLRRLIAGIRIADSAAPPNYNSREMSIRIVYVRYQRLSCQCDGRRTDTGPLPACQCNGASVKLKREGRPVPVSRYFGDPLFWGPRPRWIGDPRPQSTGILGTPCRSPFYRYIGDPLVRIAISLK